jgi:hypothetical protein
VLSAGWIGGFDARAGATKNLNIFPQTLNDVRAKPVLIVNGTGSTPPFLTRYRAGARGRALEFERAGGQAGLISRDGSQRTGWEQMRMRIQDEFTDLPISRQRKYQLRMQRDRRCTECGEPAAEGSRCLKHLINARERQRRKRGLKRRYYGTLSYQLEGVR